MSKISRFTSKVVQLAKNAVGERGEVVRARTWSGEFRELVLMCSVHNIKQSLTA
jgi:IS5 family transposase